MIFEIETGSVKQNLAKEQLSDRLKEVQVQLEQIKIREESLIRENERLKLEQS